MVDLVYSDLLFNSPRTRQVKLQAAGAEGVYDAAQWVVGNAGVAGEPGRVSYLGYRIRRRNAAATLGPARLDLAPHDAFCRGELPAPVYADWLQENGVDLPDAAYEVLRWTVG